MSRPLVTLASAMSLVFWIAWLILNLSIVHWHHGDPDHSWYCWGVAIPSRFLWLVRHSLLIWCMLGVLPACKLIADAYRRWISRRLPLGCCVRCRYNLTGNTSGVCPECGTAVTGKTRT